MFASIVNYKKQAYYEQHSKGYIITKHHIYLATFFSSFTVTPDYNTYALAFSDETSRINWQEQCLKHSDFVCDMTFTENDRTITLSTCLYSFPDARYVLIGKLTQLS